MDYKIYRLKFNGAVHFGKRSPEAVTYAFCADTFFSALCQEAVKAGEETLQMLLSHAGNGTLLLSDAFPYIGSACYLPKPVMRVETEDARGDSVIKKAYKKLKYIPTDALDDYLSGTYDVLHAPDMGRLGTFEMKVSASIRGEEETVPYRIGTYYFHSGNGLYLIVGYGCGQAQELFEYLLNGLSFIGIGGKRAAGMGRFTFFVDSIPFGLQKRLEREGIWHMSLSASLPEDDELETALSGAQYILCKRSGFVSSNTYAPEQTRKKDLYVLQAGSCFRTKYEGGIYDVSADGRHPVYRYAKPMFMEVDAWSGI